MILGWGLNNDRLVYLPIRDGLHAWDTVING
jgi:hypothetical protein